MWLNCDLGESFGAWRMASDEKVMPMIDQANIACGFHAGDPLTISQTINSAVEHNLQIGAHPSYPDLVGFGRRHMAMSHEELVACIQYQVAALQSLVAIKGQTLKYVKPHGALYNDVLKHENVRHAVMSAVSEFDGLTLMLQAGQHQQQWRAEASELELALWFEAFIDRRYEADGSLRSRRLSGAVLPPELAYQQAKLLIEKGQVVTSDGLHLSIDADTLCVHGDNPDCVALVNKIRALLNNSQ